MSSPVVMYRCESWTMKKAEHQRIHAFELWCWRRLLRVPCKDSYKDSKEIKPVNPKGNQPWIFIGRTEAEASVLWLSDENHQLIGKDTNPGNDWRQKEKRVQRMWWLDGITNSMDMNLSKLQEIVKGREAWCVVIHGVPKSWTWLSDWTAAAAVCIKSMKTKRRWKEYPQNLKNIHYLFYRWYLLRTQIKGLEMQEVGGIYFGGQLSVFFRKASILKRTIHQNWDKIKNGRITIEVIFIVSLKT